MFAHLLFVQFLAFHSFPCDLNIDVAAAFETWMLVVPVLQAPALEPAEVETLPQMLRLAEVFGRRPVQENLKI